MKFFKKRTELIEAKKVAECIKTYRIYEIRKDWSDNAGAYVYVLWWGDKSEYSDDTSDVYSRYPGDTYQRGMSPALRGDAYGRYEYVQGDKEWAQRIAEHYGIEMPDEVER